MRKRYVKEGSASFSRFLAGTSERSQKLSMYYVWGGCGGAPGKIPEDKKTIAGMARSDPEG